ncbi:hypothetical protein B1813_19030 [Saccharomonospora piscinae]|uniref:Uncharacterized protein n=1 Tax=Saccharomonospora piscinae TaxID=687388 RepID=A0A1V8ZYF4_SACPI|nr:hypothetical protein [Saccharomonospora piscinae]OQO89935.1 hypothetical protein B1813_19030 [Saccharomonospora piscinae]
MAERTVSVKLKAEIAQYVASMRAAGRATSDLEKASLQVQAAFSAEQDAAGRVRVAETRLNQVRSNSRSSALQLAQAEEQLASAQRSHATARERAIVLTEQYIADQQRLSTATDGATESVERQGRATERVARRANVQFRALATAIIAGLPAASSVASGALVGGLGAAFIGVGAIGLRESEALRATWEGLGSTLSDDLADDAAVLEDELVGAADQIDEAFQRLRPQLRAAFAGSEPLVEDFVGSLTDMAERAMPGFVEAIENAGPAVSGFRGLAGQLGQTVGDLAAELSDYSDEAGEGFVHLGDLVDEVLLGIAPILGDLTTLWAEHGDQVADVVGGLLDSLGSITSGALPGFSSALGVALELLSAVLAVIEPIAPALGTMAGAWLAVTAAMKAVGVVRSAVSGVAGSVARLGDSMQNTATKAKGFRAAGAAIALAVGVAADEMFRLNPEVEKLASSLGTLSESGRVSGELLDTFGEDLSGVGQALDMLNDTGITRFFNEIGEQIPGMDALTTTLGEAETALSSLDAALASIAESEGQQAAEEAFQQVADKAGLAGPAVQELRDRLPQFADAMETAASSTDQATEALNTYLEAQRAATDPVFALGQAVRDVDEAQRAYTEAVETYTADSPQARQASWDLAEAISGAEQAALNGELSFEQFDFKLKQWVAQGVLTSAQASDLRGRVADLRGEAEDYRGNYTANIHARTGQASVRIRALLDLVNSIPISRTMTLSAIIPGQALAAMTAMRALGMEDGGILRFADGSEDHRAQIAPAGAWRVWAEPETGGEAYIPLAESKRARSTDILATVAGEFGYSLAPAVRQFADGGASMVQGRPSIARGGDVSYTFNFPNYVGNRDELVTTLRKEIAHGGGDVQKYLGRS